MNRPRIFALLSAVALFVSLLIAAAGRAVVSADDGVQLNPFVGVVSERPEGAIGTWIVDGIGFSADAETAFPDGLPEVGDCVKLEFTQVNGALRVASIALSEDCSGEDEEVLEFVGKIVSVPENGVGTWIIGDQSFERAGPPLLFIEQFAVGVCVKVTFVEEDETKRIITIEFSDDCNEEETRFEYRGIIATLPENGIGTWVIGEQSFAVDAETELPATLPAVGDCVKVYFVEDGAVKRAIKIQTDDDCIGNDEEDLSVYGFITQLPADSRYGEWRINDQLYSVVEGETSFQNDYGAFRIGICVEVSYRLDGESRIALAIESKPFYRCFFQDDEEDEPLVLYGTIDTLPATESYTGTWVVGGQRILVDVATELEHGPFAIGDLVEVHYVVEADGQLRAVRIAGKQEDDNDDGFELSKAIAVVEELPASDTLTGTWLIGGLSYTVTERTALTRFANSADFAVGSCVVVYFTSDDDGGREAKLIVLRDANACEVDDDETDTNKIFGFVDERPDTYIGEWIVGGIVFSATAETEFDSSLYAPVVGSFVGVRYSVVDEVRVALAIKTYIPPGLGEFNDEGVLEIPAETLQASDTTWQIGGVDYVISDATLLDSSNGALESGTTVRVNSYEDANGDRVATLVSAVGTDLYLPLVLR